ncbi:MAG: hypothetical protein KDA27_18170 [Candidatus Eisenbacteria bacterium]|uniref:6-bladed beta-propeller n=1 Tax=Eiseniibacteriota bacterium TaxID=2212470 RepID=A0A956SGT8_UNCEI|nr:hypothetical protein [Candidatus Eisenbacteria bacterium]
MPTAPSPIVTFLAIASVVAFAGRTTYALAEDADPARSDIDVWNSATPAKGSGAVSLNEVWRTDPGTDDERDFFGLIAGLDAGPDGRVYVLDSQLFLVRVYERNGDYVGSFGREGEGPGEFYRPAAVMATASGIEIPQLVPSRVVRFDRDGEPTQDGGLPRPEDGGPQGFLGGAASGGVVVFSCWADDFQENARVSHRYLARWDDEQWGTVYHSEIREFVPADPVIDENVYDTFDRRWDVGADGRVYAVTKNGDYTIYVWAADGSLERRIHREAERIDREPDEIDQVRRYYEAVTRGIDATIRVNEYHRMIETLFVRDDGTLWVLPTAGVLDRPNGAIGVFDVFDGEGTFVRSVTLMGEGDPFHDGLYVVGDRLFVARGQFEGRISSWGGEADDDAAPMAVICYEFPAP